MSFDVLVSCELVLAYKHASFALSPSHLRMPLAVKAQKFQSTTLCVLSPEERHFI
jgi:hypothetical protein